jgi:hypothetical protein
MHPNILQTVFEVCGADDQLANADHRSIWRKLFLDGILREKPSRPKYWVVDGLDECRAESEVVRLLLKASEMYPVRILVTSCNRFESHKVALGSKTEVVSEEISPNDTKSVIALFLDAHIDQLPSVDEEARQNMVSKILTKSGGCFLWVSLVLQELSLVHTSSENRQVLEDVPSDMDALYSRVLDSMSVAQYVKALAKAILIWTACAARPLTTKELYHALQIDIRDTIDSIEKAIRTSCGQLIYVDAQSRVQIVHQTARDFLLLSDIDSEFAIDRRRGHKRIAMTCLGYLSGNELKPRRRRKLSVNNVKKEGSDFVNYASNSLFEHMAHVSSTDEDFMFALAKFLSSPNVLSWIEHVSQTLDLKCLNDTGKAFTSFLQRRSEHMSPFRKEVALLDLGPLTSFG